jgi:hypothetical protein
MKKEDFEKMVGDPLGCMVFHMENWESDPRISPDTYHQILVNTMKTYLQALALKDDVLLAKCVAKFDEIRQFNKIN